MKPPIEFEATLAARATETVPVEEAAWTPGSTIT